MKKLNLFVLGVSVALFFISCNNDDDSVIVASKDINTAERQSIDRFSSTAGHLMVRNATNGLPAANAPIDFDNQPFITTGLDRNGMSITYYNFDIQSTTPAPIYVFFKQGESSPLAGQNNIVGVIPGDANYNDFWNVVKVTVPDNYVSNSVTSESAVLSSGFLIEETAIIVNCPIVPFGSTASRSFTVGQPSELTLGWYNNKAVAYFNFSEASLSETASGMVPVSPIYVMFNDNAAGPSSGFVVEPNTSQTHNVLGTIPGDINYSPLWSVLVLDNANFASVSDLSTASSFPNTVAGANVNCPVVK